jgi:hypothetical protein
MKLKLPIATAVGNRRRIGLRLAAAGVAGFRGETQTLIERGNHVSTSFPRPARSRDVIPAGECDGCRHDGGYVNE